MGQYAKVESKEGLLRVVGDIRRQAEELALETLKKVELTRVLF